MAARSPRICAAVRAGIAFSASEPSRQAGKPMTGIGHALYYAVAGQGRVRGEAAAAEAPRDKQVLERGERAARVGADGEWKGRVQQPDREDARCRPRARRACAGRGRRRAASAQARARPRPSRPRIRPRSSALCPPRASLQEEGHQRHDGALLRKMHQRGLSRCARRR